MSTITSPGPSTAPNPSDPARQGGIWHIQGIGTEARGFTYVGSATNSQAAETLRFARRLRGSCLLREVQSSRPPTFRLVDYLIQTLGKPNTVPEILSNGQLSDSTGDLPTYTVWEFPPGETAKPRDILRRTFP